MTICTVPTQRRDDILDLIFGLIDNLMYHDQDALDMLLLNLDPCKLDVDISLGYLTASLPVRKKLKGRAVFRGLFWAHCICNLNMSAQETLELTEGL